jgi:hypothetical protein
MAALKTVFNGQVAQVPWKANWLAAQASTQTPQELRLYPGEQVH